LTTPPTSVLLGEHELHQIGDIGFEALAAGELVFHWTKAKDIFSRNFPDFPLLLGNQIPHRFGPGAVTVGGVVATSRPNSVALVEGPTHVTSPASFRYGGVLGHTQLEHTVSRMQQLLAVLKSQLLRGGIHYTDPETNYMIVAPSGIPESQIHADPLPLDVLCSRIDALVARCGGGEVIVHERFADALGELTAAHPDFIVRYIESDLTEAVDAANNGKDLLWPEHAVVVITGLAEFPPGRTWLTRGENPDREPNIWARVIHQGSQPVDPTQNPDNQHPLLSEDHFQVGLSALPALDEPERIHVFTLQG
jgi:hypothetical protein